MKTKLHEIKLGDSAKFPVAVTVLKLCDEFFDEFHEVLYVHMFTGQDNKIHCYFFAEDKKLVKTFEGYVIRFLRENFIEFEK